MPPADSSAAPADRSARTTDAGERPRRLTRRAARARRVLGWTLLAAPAVLVLASDFARRGDYLLHLGARGAAFYAFCTSLGALIWSGLLVVASRRRGGPRWLAHALLVLAAGFAVGAQYYTYARYMAYMDAQAVVVGTQMLPSIGQQLWADRATFAQALLPPIALAGALPFALRSLAPARPRRALLAIDAAVVAFLLCAFVSPSRGAQQGQPPDVMYVSAMGQLARARWDHNECVERVHPGPRTPTPVPPVAARPKTKRNVIVVLTESVRAVSTCEVPGAPDCEFTPFSHEATPHRIALHQMRTVDSTTAISLAVMWSGLAPDESRKALHSAPLVWEYAHAANVDTAYWTSQNLLFGNSGAWVEGLPLTRSVSATQLEPDAELEVGADDGKLADYVATDVGELREPYFGVVHLSNTHFPYKVDHRFAPFLPEEEATGPGYEREIRNRYQDAVYLQDRAVGRLVKAIRARPESDRTIIVYLSDHGEQMHEKGAVGHTGTLYDVEIRIPFWIDAPPGALTEDEEKHLRALANEPVTSLDVMPTLLDLLGLLDAPELASLRARMPGQSLLRGGSPKDRPVFLTNCTELWACAFKNWGAIRGTHKVIANQGDHAWSCFDVATDPEETRPLDLATCGDLAALAEAHGHGRPF